MTDFVRNDIGLRELAGVAVSATAEFVLEVVKERGIEINALPS